MTKDYIGKFYDGIMYRQLLVDRNDEMIDKLEILLKEVVGNKYGISASKLIKKRNTVKPSKG